MNQIVTLNAAYSCSNTHFLQGTTEAPSPDRQETFTICTVRPTDSTSQVNGKKNHLVLNTGCVQFSEDPKGADAEMYVRLF